MKSTLFFVLDTDRDGRCLAENSFLISINVSCAPNNATLIIAEVFLIGLKEVGEVLQIVRFHQGAMKEFIDDLRCKVLQTKKTVSDEVHDILV
jgi:hypothetical protein